MVEFSFSPESTFSSYSGMYFSAIKNVNSNPSLPTKKNPGAAKPIGANWQPIGLASVPGQKTECFCSTCTG